MPIKTEIRQDLIDRVAGMTRQKTDWFSPMKPIPPVAQESAGRQWDYPSGYNTRTTVKDDGISFRDMRALADSYDLLRLVIESRKDQLCKLDWQIIPKDEKAKPDQGAFDIQTFLQRPDREHDWDGWLRMLLEDLFVLDAPTIYPRKTRGGELWALELIDGATIRRLIDASGRTPLPPEAAYQQILKGVPASTYKADEIHYLPRNPRTHKVYGYSPVEQVIITVNIALRRQKGQLDYYTEGNVPDALIGVPETWTPEQIKQFQGFWDTLIEGSQEQKRKAKFVPGQFKYQPTREPVLKDLFDEWLARVVCYAMSVSPQPFIKDINRATAETALESALEEGLAPIMRWVANTMNRILAFEFGRPDLQFAWKNSKSIDPETQSRIHTAYITAKVLTPDEVRADIGLEPLTPEERDAAFPEPVAPQGDPGDDPDDPDAGRAGSGTDPDADPDEGGAAKMEKSAGKSIDRGRAAVTDAARSIQGVIEAALSKLAATVTEQLTEAMATVGKADENEIARIMASIELDGLLAIVDDTGAALEAVTADGALTALIQLGIVDATDDMLNLVNEQAVQYARERAAELVGMKRGKDGKLKPNPSAKWRIDEPTRQGIRALIVEAMNEGWSNDRLAHYVKSAYTFSPERAEVIARTETAHADTQGNLIAYKAAEVERKQWLTAPECCPLCAALDGKVVDIDAEFSDGVTAPPLHPNCRCDFLPVLETKEKSK